MRKIVGVAVLLLTVLPLMAKDDEAKIKEAVAEGYKLWVAAANKKDAAALAGL